MCAEQPGIAQGDLSAFVPPGTLAEKVPTPRVMRTEFKRISII